MAPLSMPRSKKKFLIPSSRSTVVATATSKYALSLIFSKPTMSRYDSAQREKVEDVMPTATGHEREEREAALEGRDLLDINHPAGPFGTKAFKGGDVGTAMATIAIKCDNICNLQP